MMGTNKRKEKPMKLNVRNAESIVRYELEEEVAETLAYEGEKAFALSEIERVERLIGATIDEVVASVGNDHKAAIDAIADALWLSYVGETRGLSYDEAAYVYDEAYDDASYDALVVVVEWEEYC